MRKLVGLLLQRLGGGGLLHQRGVLLRHVVELGDRAVDLPDAVGLVRRRGADLADDVVDALLRGNDLFIVAPASATILVPCSTLSTLVPMSP